ncbi:MAG TPA: hypothetical protein VM889_01855 [Candidatus Thermoplasmatota archaeon]|nr:hypothetical protein [Candidatus Thermoplasmatota archaeon]
MIHVFSPPMTREVPGGADHPRNVALDALGRTACDATRRRRAAACAGGVFLRARRAAFRGGLASIKGP